MIESLLIVLYTATIFLIFHWLMKNDDKPALADETGWFRISSSRPADGQAESRGRSSGKLGRPNVPDAAPGAPAEGESSDTSDPTMAVRTRSRQKRRSGRGARRA